MCGITVSPYVQVCPKCLEIPSVDPEPEPPTEKVDDSKILDFHKKKE